MFRCKALALDRYRPGYRSFFFVMPTHIFHGANASNATTTIDEAWLFKNTVGFVSPVSAPSTISFTVPASVPIHGATIALLGEPTAWLRVLVGGVAYKMPLYA
jgi:hypothetical protein